MTRVAVVGGGIAGLAAAVALRGRADVVVLESSPRLGGKLRTAEFAGDIVETGAETFLTREAGADSAALTLARALGLDLVHPAPVPAALALGGQLRPIPAGTLLGIPSDTSNLDGVAEVSTEDASLEPLLGPGEDIAVGALVRRQFGDQVVDRLVDPMLGGVYAGRADELSLAVTMPGLHVAAQQHTTLAAAVRAAMDASPRPAGTPVFTSVRGGLSRLVEAMAAHVDVRTGATVRELYRHGPGWRLIVGSTRDAVAVEADAVILAVPAAPATRLLADLAPATGLEYASVALVTLALPPGTPLPELSGFLVPATEGYTVKAATFFTTKWPHLRGEGTPVLVRASIGRHREEHVLQQSDEALIEVAGKDLRDLLGDLPAPRHATLTRWGGGLPQYGVGHAERVTRLRAALPPRIAVAGAAYDGVGIAACIRSGQTAADIIVRTLEGSSA
jgi:protoporphyrinogen/coproporphyrinogen III oxidase